MYHYKKHKIVHNKYTFIKGINSSLIKLHFSKIYFTSIKWALSILNKKFWAGISFPMYRISKAYKGCPWIFETLAILSKGLNIIQINLHSHLVLHIWDLGLNYLTAAFNGYDSVAFWRLTPPLHQSMSHSVGVNSTGVLLYYCLTAHAIINNFASKRYLWQ